MIHSPARLFLGAGLLVAGLALRAQPAPAVQPQVIRPLPPAQLIAPNARSGDEIIDSFKLADADIDAVLGALEAYTGRAVIRPGTLPIATGGYSLKLSHIPKSELILALETLLSLNQIGVVPMGDRFLKVVPLAVTRAEAPEFIKGSTLGLPPSGRIATKLFQLEFLRANEFFNTNMNTLLTPGIGGGVVLLEKANAALVTDTVSNLQRLESLITSVDKPMLSGISPRFYPLHYAKASDLVTKIHSLLSTGAIQNEVGSTTTFQADDRTNQVVVLCDPREQAFFDSLIEKLDVKSDPNTRNEVIYLKHADAKDLTTVLSALITGQTQAAQKATGGQTTGGAPTQPNAPVGGAKEPGTTEFSNYMTIQADERSNSVVVSGTVDDIRLIRELIEKLDIALAQVRIQVVIAEVTLDDTDQSGLTALGLTVGQQSNGATGITNFTGSIPGWDVTSGVVSPLAFQTVMDSATQGSKSLVHILSAPVIVTAHNKAAEVVVGEQEPIITGTTQTPISTTAASNTGFATSSTVTYQTIAIDLKVTPLIGENGDVQLTIDQKVDDIDGNVTIDGNQQPIIGHREATSFLTVKDKQMIVLGGLQRTQKSITQGKLGLLYEIPILSQLLGGNTTELQRTELLFFIRPNVLLPEEGSADTRKRIEELTNRQEIEKFLKSATPAPDSKSQNFLDRFKSQ